jgi:thiamine kinase-like enzyme
MTAPEETAEARSVIARLPAFAGQDPAAARITRLGGLTNRVFRVELGGASACLRLPGRGTESYIDRRVEAINARAAAAAGVSPDVLHASPDGVMVTRYLEGCATMTPELFRSVPGAPARAARAFRALHTSAQTFAYRFELFAKIDEYLAHLAPLAVELPAGYHAVVAEAGGIRTALAAHPLPIVACHCDPLCENLLDDGDRMWIVDWEYSGMNDPMWDLGDFSVEAGFGPVQDAEMMEAYFGAPPHPFDAGRMVIYKAMCDLLWTLWGLIQVANENPADDFQAYAATRFGRCKALMASPDFPRHLAAIRAGP